jgi:hypothetical protein
MKKMPVSLTNSAQAAIIFIAIGMPWLSAWAAMTEPYASYTVKPGDSVQSLSRSLLNDPGQWAELARQNGMANANAVQAGQVIEIPKSLLNLGSQPRLAVMGRLVSTVGDVRIGGQSVQAGVAVPEGARIETGANGSALVELGDGSRMQLMPRTLADVTSQHGYALRDPASSASTTWFSGAIRLVSGVLDTLANKQAKRATPLAITTPTSVIGVRGTHFRVAYEDPATGTSRAEVLEGKVLADNPAQQASADLATGYGAAIQPQEREIKAVLLLPALARSALPKEVLRIVGAHNEPEQAVWTVGRLAGANGYHAQFAADEQFASLQGDFKSSTPSLDVKALANGGYFARVRGIDPAGIEGYDAVQLVEVKTAAPQPALAWPREITVGAHAVFIPGGVVLTVNRKSVDMPAALIAQFALDAAFTQSLQSLPVAADATVRIPQVLAGQRYFVRFAGSSPQGQSASSPVFTLDVPANWGSTVQDLAQALQNFR